MIRCRKGRVLPSMNDVFATASPRRVRDEVLAGLLAMGRPQFRDAGAQLMADDTVSAETVAGATDLMRRIAEDKDRQAFEVLFAHFAPRVKSYMLKLGANDALADELAQETLLAVWRKAEKFDRAKAAPSTWIFTIARNLRIDAYRKTVRPELDPNDPALVPDPEEPQDHRVDRLQRAEAVRRAMSALSDEQADVVRLSFFEDLSHSIIAERLDVPLGTVKSRLRLAFAKIREAVGDGLQ